MDAPGFNVSNDLDYVSFYFFMKKLFVCILTIMTLVTSCVRHQINTAESNLVITEQLNYHLYDSSYVGINNMPTGGGDFAIHTPINIDIALTKIISSHSLVYMTDTLPKTSDSPERYGWPTYFSCGQFTFSNDSITICKFMGGVGFTTWTYFYGVKI